MLYDFARQDRGLALVLFQRLHCGAGLIILSQPLHRYWLQGSALSTILPLLRTVHRNKLQHRGGNPPCTPEWVGAEMRGAERAGGDLQLLVDDPEEVHRPRRPQLARVVRFRLPFQVGLGSTQSSITLLTCDSLAWP